ncbi:MAG: hypothetical protein IJL90_00220 [Lachnospiraceae bacterium]|nr:hypothetical protein [Lachnospiraceae bacterium]
MIVFKGFHKGMVCTMGRGKFKYKLGKKAYADAAKTANTGLHSTREPFGILSYYSNHGTDVYCICEAAGDINEDSQGRVASTELTPLKKLTPQELAIYEGIFVQKHPELSDTHFNEHAEDNGYYAVARGKNPTARGKKGTVIVLLQEYARSHKIKKLEIFEIDGRTNKAGLYGIGGRINAKGDAAKPANLKSHSGNSKQGAER